MVGTGCMSRHNKWTFVCQEEGDGGGLVLLGAAVGVCTFHPAYAGMRQGRFSGGIAISQTIPTAHFAVDPAKIGPRSSRIKCLPSAVRILVSTFVCHATTRHSIAHLVRAWSKSSAEPFSRFFDMHVPMLLSVAAKSAPFWEKGYSQGVLHILGAALVLPGILGVVLHILGVLHALGVVSDVLGNVSTTVQV